MLRDVVALRWLIILATSSLSAQALDFLSVDARSEVQQQFFNQLQASLGHGDEASAARLETLQAQLACLHAAMPKNDDGGLGPDAARYALHRFFVQKHGWHVRGLETTGAEKWSDAASTGALADRIPSYVLELFDQHRGGRTGLRELAMLAATLEDVVHSEAVQLLSTVFGARGRSLEESISASTEQGLIQTYLLFHLMPNPMYAELDLKGLNSVLKRQTQIYPGWSKTVLWAQDVRSSVLVDEASRRNPFVPHLELRRTRDFNSIVRQVERMGETFGQFQNLECRELKNVLIELSDGSGRVQLAKFYQAKHEGRSSRFVESPEYLRHLGVLDETEPSQPSVVLTNYIYARSNCMAASGLYSVCCIDDCEALMALLEKNISNPLAHPRRLAERVAAMSSETVAAPRDLSAVLRRRLDDIAEYHGGSVPLHGRLFAQWMHHAFPNECQYPHAAGSLESPLTPREWFHSEGRAGLRHKVSEEQMSAIMKAASLSNASDAPGSVLPWSEEEELAVAVPGLHAMGKARLRFRAVALCVAVFSAGLGLVRMLGPVLAQARPAREARRSSQSSQKLDKQLV